MNWFTRLFVAGAAQPIEAVGNVMDKLFTSDDEKLARAEVMARIQQAPQMVQAEINKIEAASRSVFVAGWRPFLGWVCGVGLANVFLINPWLQWLTDQPGPVMPVDVMTELVIALLGLGALRTAEKFGGRAK
jgi:Holin of 3TMs, for gene-transfer release